MKKLVLPLALSLSLASCAVLLPSSPYTLGKQPAAGDLNPTGTVTGNVTGSMVMTRAQVMGLKPNQYYVAHYHKQGKASTVPCESGGAAIMSSKIVGQTDENGMLMLAGRVTRADVASATYFNIHTAKDAAGAPADAGVACTAVEMIRIRR